jgi:multiple sugar transport system substrate-binding protein
LEFASFTASPAFQKTIYTDCGGQPGHRSAWLDERANNLTRSFFMNALPAHDRAYLRPRYNGFIPFQDEACLVVHAWLSEGGNPSSVLDRVEGLYQKSRNPDQHEYKSN